VKTSIYVDGFNLYYGALRHTKYKWLNPLEVCRLLLKPKMAGSKQPLDLQSLRYFTAKVTPRPKDPGQLKRQQTYIRALKTIPNVTIHYGRFLVSKIWRPATGGHSVLLTGGLTAELSTTDPPQQVRIYKTEEKGSDVNLATHLINDAHLGNYECAVVISNDSDLVEPINIVKDALGFPVIVISPHKKNPSFHLQKTATYFLREIRPAILKRSQFPATMTDDMGTFNKPPEW
jgi:uncharacterized LabA/DUF88 family protein